MESQSTHCMNADETDLNTLLDRIGRGETDLYLQVVRRFELMLRGYLAGQLYNLAEADDLAQEVFIAAWRDLAGFRRGEDFGAWLRGIARNRLLAHFRSQQRRANAVERFQAEVARIAEQELDAAALAERVAEAARRNPQTEVQLSADQAVPYGRVAELIGIVQKGGLTRIGFVAQNAAAGTRASARNATAVAIAANHSLRGSVCAGWTLLDARH
jgi:RNA polymerase sigma factor (sigma-70 family)